MENCGEKKKKRRRKKKSNLAVHDDDINWQSLAPLTRYENQSDLEESDDETPIIAGIKDDSVKRWQPVSSIGCDSKGDKLHLHVPKRKRVDSTDLSPERRNDCATLSMRVHVDDDVRPLVRSSSNSSPERKEIVGRKERRGTASLVVQRQETKEGCKRRRPCSPLKREFGLCIISDDFSPPRRQRIEHRSRIHGIDKVMQGYNCSDTITNSEVTQSLLGNSEGKSLHVKAQTQKTLQDKQLAVHQEVNTIMCDHHIETIYRDREGHKIDPTLQEIEKEQKETKYIENEKFMLWGRG